MSLLVTNAEGLVTLSVVRSLGRKNIEVTAASDEKYAYFFAENLELKSQVKEMQDTINSVYFRAKEEIDWRNLHTVL